MGNDGPMRSRLLVVVLLGILAVIVVQQRDGSGDANAPTPSATALITDPTGPLPPEALETIALIQRDGPFPHRQDGVVFQNRERLLPIHDRGYWREYTVPTPGESDRGARRIIHGMGGEYYYTDDHYASFSRIRVPDPALR